MALWLMSVTSVVDLCAWDMGRAQIVVRVRVRVEVVEMRLVCGTIVVVFPHINLAFAPVRFIISARQNGRCHVVVSTNGFGFRRLVTGEEVAVHHS